MEEINIALLIDAENISAKYIDLIIDEANRYGRLSVKRIYGDWTTTQLGPWKSKCIEFGLTQIQQFTVVNGKNSADFSLVIDAMDILYGNKVKGFCIVSSDSDFTRLVNRIKEDNVYVWGIGESKTPISLVNSCEIFSYIDLKYKTMIDEEQKAIVKKVPVKVEKDTKEKDNNNTSVTPIETIIKGINSIIDEIMDDDDWAYWGNVAQLLKKKFPGFHPKNYGSNTKIVTFLTKDHNYKFKTIKTSLYVKKLD